MTHIIRRQYLHVELNGTESEGLALQHRLSDLCQQLLIPAIEGVLDHCAPPRGHLIIDRLEIDAGTLTLERLEDELAESVTEVLEKVLQEQIPTGDFLSVAPDNDNVQHKTTQQTINEVFIFFLKTGSLPWWFHLPQGKNLEQTILESWQEMKRSDDVLRSKESAVLHTLYSATARKRLTCQFSSVFIENLLSRLSPAKDVVVSLLKSQWPEAGKKVNTDRTKNAEPIPADLPVSKKKMAYIDNKPEEPTKKSPDYVDSYLDIKEGLYIDHAGLVLLHPFLPQFFESLNVIAGDKLLQPDRALCLLHFLVTGQVFAPEYELILPKILCNIPLETPVEANVELKIAELEEAEALLEAVIRHWKALRNTSIDGLRETFLVRPGKVSLHDNGDWLLQVESITFDILMNQLPWGIGMIKLPWMDKMLWVEW
jgi:hypothetical protein